MILEYNKPNNLGRLHEELMEIEELKPIQDGEFLMSVFTLQGKYDYIKIICNENVDVKKINEVVNNHIV